MQSFEITDDKLYELPFTGKKDIYYIIFVCVGIALIALVNELPLAFQRNVNGICRRTPKSRLTRLLSL